MLILTRAASALAARAPATRSSLSSRITCTTRPTITWLGRRRCRRPIPRISTITITILAFALAIFLVVAAISIIIGMIVVTSIIAIICIIATAIVTISITIFTICQEFIVLCTEEEAAEYDAAQQEERLAVQLAAEDKGKGKGKGKAKGKGGGKKRNFGEMSASSGGAVVGWAPLAPMAPAAQPDVRLRIGEVQQVEGTKPMSTMSLMAMLFTTKMMTTMMSITMTTSNDDDDDFDDDDISNDASNEDDDDDDKQRRP